MNKLFTKFASLSLGLALVASAGAFLGNKTIKSASATEALSQKCDFSAAKTGNTAYGSEWTYDNDYKVFGGANNNAGWAYVTFGSKKSKASDPVKETAAYVKTASAVADDITKITFTVTTARKFAGTVTVSLDVASDSEFANISDTVSLGTVDQYTAATHTIEPTSGTSWGSNNYYRLNINCSNNSTSNGMFSLTEIDFYYESSIPVGTLSIVPFDNKVLTTGDSGALNYSFEPASGDSATITSATWSSNNTDVLSVSGSTYTAEGPGSFRLSLSAEDSNGQTYNVDGEFYFVSNALSFSVGDEVAIVSNAKDTIPSYELTGINKDSSNHIGIATEYSGDPTGSYRLEVGVGETTGSYTFSNEGNFISWSSGNTLSSITSVSEKSSWYVIAYADYVSIVNASDTTRDLLMNQNVQSGTPNPRFACYSGNSTYPRSNIVVLPEPENPRGTVTITSPTETSLKLGDTGSLSYSWTPNSEAPSETISSIVWESSDSNVISVDNSLFTYEAIAPGTAKLSYEATDTLGEVYTGTTNVITVYNKVSGDYVKYTSVAVGDTVSLVCETAETELAGIVKIGSNYVGDYSFYETAPASLYDLTLVEGVATDSFAFETSDSKYLTWESGNTLNVAETITTNSSWSISFDDDGNALISNVADNTRSIRWNNTNPRFATYNSAQTAVQLYGPDTDIEVSYYGMQFINNLRGYTCDETGKTAPSTSTWENLNIIYDRTGISEIPAEDKELFRTITAVEHENPQTNRAKVEAAIAKYDYIVAKYNKTLGLVDEYPDFIGRDPAPLKSAQINNNQNSNINISVLAVVIVAVTSVSAIGVLLVVKKRKNHI